MVLGLLRPLLLSYKNRFLRRTSGGHFFGIELVVIFLSIIVMVGIYWSALSLMLRLAEAPELMELVPPALLRLGVHILFFLMILSSFISAIGVFFESHDLRLFLGAPVSRLQIYLARYIETLLNASWIFVLFGVPLLLAFRSALHLEYSFLLVSFVAMIPLLGIATALGVILALLFVNIVPKVRLTDVVTVAVFVLVFFLALSQQSVQIKNAPPQASSRSVALSVIMLGSPQSVYSPSRWAAEVMESFVVRSEASAFPALLILLSAGCAALGLGYLVFDLCHWRGWNLTTGQSRKSRVGSSPFRRKVGRILFPAPPQFRAIALKEARMFLRDSSQSLQLIFILAVTCLYIFNFPSLRYVSNLGTESHNWLKVFLCVVNICLGASVVAAVATRFVYPSISLEGRAYAVLRSAPLSLFQYLRYKFLTWFIPLALLEGVLVIIGARALGMPPVALVVSAFLSLPFAASSIAIATGVGAVYARFDWDSPAQVTSSFGGIVQLGLSLLTIGLSAPLAGYAFLLVLVPNFSIDMGTLPYFISMFCAFFLVYYIHFTASRLALEAGGQSLQDLER